LLEGIGARQIVVDGSFGGNAAAAANGTLYYVQNPNVATVTPDGLIQAVGVGSTRVTVIAGGLQKDIEVRVAALPGVGPQAIVAEDGGIARVDGLSVQIGPGALAADTVVEIESLELASLALAPPALPGYTTIGAFQLDVGSHNLKVPAQVAIAAPGAAAGSSAFFYKLSTFIDDQDQERQFWLLVDTGVVGNDGIARTASPPLDGIGTGGVYLVTTYVNALVSELKFIGGVSDALLYNPTYNIGVLAGNVRAAGFAVATDLIEMYQLRFGKTYKVVKTVPPAGAPPLDIEKEFVGRSPRTNLVIAPLIDRVEFLPDHVLKIVGMNLDLRDLEGHEQGRMEVRFTSGDGGRQLRLTPTLVSLVELRVALPDGFPAAGARIEVLHVLQDRSLTPAGSPSTAELELQSNSLTIPARHGLTLAMRASSIAVFSGE